MKRESFAHKRGDISRGDETTNPRRELHLHRRTVLHQTRRHAHTRITDRHLPFHHLLPLLSSPPPFDRRRSARKREGRHRFPLTLQGLIYIFFPGAESRFTSIRGNTPRSEPRYFQPLREREISRGRRRSRQGEGRRKRGARERLNKVENATTVFLVLSFGFRDVFPFFKGRKDFTEGVFQYFYRYVRMYIYTHTYIYEKCSLRFRREKGGRFKRLESLEGNRKVFRPLDGTVICFTSRSTSIYDCR